MTNQTLDAEIKEQYEELLGQWQESLRELQAAKAKHQEVGKLLNAVHTILRLRGGIEGPPPHPEENEAPRRKKRSGISATAQRREEVVKLLKKIHPRPMHFRNIHLELARTGMTMPLSRNPANALLVTFSTDPRLERIGRGTYRARTP